MFPLNELATDLIQVQLPQNFLVLQYARDLLMLHSDSGLLEFLSINNDKIVSIEIKLLGYTK